MHHIKFLGTHYEMGYHWGCQLKKHNQNLLDHIPFPISEEHLSFSKQCLPLYATFFPEILEEIQGLSEGNSCSYEKLCAVLFSMYCIMPCPIHCSCFAAKSDEDHIILGRNSDFLTEIEPLYMNTIYQFSSSAYSFNANTTAFIQMEDGINEHGFAIGLTSVAPAAIAPGFNAGLLLRFLLEQCKTVKAAMQLIKEIPLATSFTLVMADALGNAVLLELATQEIEIQWIDSTQNYVCATNMFNTKKMKPYNRLPKDTWFAKERFYTMEQFFSNKTTPINLEEAQDLLRGKEGFMCQYDRSLGKDTVWSVLYQLKDSSIYRAEGNPARNAFLKDTRTL